MFKKQTTVIVSLLALLAAMDVSAARTPHKGIYYGVKYAFLENKLCSTGDPAQAANTENCEDSQLTRGELPTAIGHLGIQFSPRFALEGRIGVALNDDAVRDGGVEVESYYGMFARYGASSARIFAPYLTAGFGRRGKASTGLSGSETSKDAEGAAAYGAGINLNFLSRTAINIEYIKYNDDLEGWAIGLQKRFW